MLMSLSNKANIWVRHGLLSTFYVFLLIMTHIIPSLCDWSCFIACQTFEVPLKYWGLHVLLFL